MKITVATCQFPTSDKIIENQRHVLRQLKIAKDRGAHVAHFPEACLAGYARHDIKSYKGFDWNLLEESTSNILSLARELRLWVILGSIHRLTGRNKPHNSLYIIDDHGRIIDRYDKMFCAGDKSEKTGELAHYSPGNHFSIFKIKGINCGTLICNEYRYPELFREYKHRHVALLFHSFHAANISQKDYKAMQKQVGAKYHKLNHGSTLPEITMPASIQAAAASNHLWISCSNSSARESCWPNFFVRPDGVIIGRLRRNCAGVLVTSIDTNLEIYDSTKNWRDRAIRGNYHSGRLVKDRRSNQRKSI